METKKKEINWKEGVARLYNVCWALFALIMLAIIFTGRTSGEKTMSGLFMATVIPYALKRAGVWIYQGFVKK